MTKEDKVHCLVIWDCQTKTYLVLDMDTVKDEADKEEDEGLISFCIGRFVLEALVSIQEVAEKKGLDPSERCVHITTSVEEKTQLQELQDETEVEDLIKSVTGTSD